MFETIKTLTLLSTLITFLLNLANENQILKLYLNLSYFSGYNECSKDQSSLREFGRGVPVIRRRDSTLKSIKVLYEESHHSLIDVLHSLPHKCPIVTSKECLK